MPARVVSAMNKITKKYIVMSLEEKFQILTVFDAVKTVLSELQITEIDQESAEATLNLIQSYNGICNISERSIIRLNDCREVVLKQRGKKIEKDFESEVWGNLMMCYFETNINLVSLHFISFQFLHFFSFFFIIFYFILFHFSIFIFFYLNLFYSVLYHFILFHSTSFYSVLFCFLTFFLFCFDFYAFSSNYILIYITPGQ